MAYILEVGKPIPNWKHPLPEGGEWNVSTDGVTLKLYYERPTREESLNFRQGKVTFGLINAGTHTFFALYNIVGVTDGWSDGSYALGLVAPEDRDFGRCTPDKGWLVRMLLIDAISGVVTSMRACTVTPVFSKIMDDLIEGQRQNLETFTKADHDHEIMLAHNRWPTPKQMINYALITEIGGQKFSKGETPKAD